jgi:4a-hydroxytetrahydrobiopterin dehydratase
MSDLQRQRCVPCTGETPRLAADAIETLLRQVPGYGLEEGGARIARTYRFKNFHETMAFVNAVAFIAHREDHHPDLEVSYGHVVVRYSTHAAGGLTENDFICAAKIDALVA